MVENKYFAYTKGIIKWLGGKKSIFTNCVFVKTYPLITVNSSKL